MELILNRLMFSDVHIIHVSEVKWAVRNTMASSLDAEQLAFLDLVLYQKEHGFSLN
jgi:Smg protein